MSALNAEVETQEPGLLQSLDHYWFGYGSPVTLGVFRILMGALLFTNFVMIGAFWDSWFSERGYVPAWMGQLYLYPKLDLWRDGPEFSRIDLINGVTDPRITIPFYGLVVLAALFTTLGLWTRVSTFVLAIGIVSLHHRNSAILHGGDTVMRVMALYLAIAPCGRACSLDRLIALWRGRAPLIPEAVSMWPQRLISYNVGLLYLTTTWLKYWGGKWKGGTATYYPAHLAEFGRFYVPPFVNELPMVRVTTYSTLAVEFALGTLVFFRPLRKWVLLSGILLHLYIEYSMNIPLFAFVMIATYISFYEGDEVTAWAKRVGKRFKRFEIEARWPKGYAPTSNRLAFLKAVDPFGWVHYSPGQAEVWESKGALVRSLGVWPCAWIPGFWSKLLNRSLEKRVEPEAAPIAAPKRKKK